MTPLPAARPSAFTTTGTSSRSFKIRDGRLGVAKHAVVGRRHVGVPQQVLAKDLAGFQLGGRARWAEGTQARVLKRIDDAGRQRRLGADDREVDLVLPGELDQPRHVGGGNGNVLGIDRRAGVAGRNEHALDARALGDLPRQRMFAAAVANNQNLHGCVLVGMIGSSDCDDLMPRTVISTANDCSSTIRRPIAAAIHAMLNDCPSFAPVSCRSSITMRRRIDAQRVRFSSHVHEQFDLYAVRCAQNVENDGVQNGKLRNSRLTSQRGEAINHR